MSAEEAGHEVHVLQACPHEKTPPTMGLLLLFERLLADWRMYGTLCRLLLLAEALLCAVIVLRVPCAGLCACASLRARAHARDGAR